MFLLRPFLPALLALGAPAIGAQTAATTPLPGKLHHAMPDGVVARIPGRVLDVAPGYGFPGGAFLVYSTQEGDVGRVVPGHEPVLLGSNATGLPNALFGVAVMPSGDVAALNAGGDVWIVPAGGGSASLRYADTYMIQDARDLVVDTAGNFLIASKTPSSGVRAINHVSFDGNRWAYWLVRHQPVALAWDPLTGDLLFTDTASNGTLRRASTSDPTRPTFLVDGTTHPFPNVNTADGDLAVQSNGDVLWAAGNDLWLVDRDAGTSSLLYASSQPLRAVAITTSSGLLDSPSGWSAYVAEGEYPTRLREIPNVGAPAPVVRPDQGWVPGRGRNLGVDPGFQIFDLAVDNAGHLLVGGGLWNQFFYVKRVTLPVPSLQSVADGGDGLAGTIEGVVVAPDDTIFAVTREGTIHAIDEAPFGVTDVFTDPADQIAAAKDLALDVDGTLYVAERSGWGWGKVLEISGGVAGLVTITDETRGLAPRPGGGMYVSQWHGTGFEGSVSAWDFGSGMLTDLPGFVSMNYTNDSVWGDGDLVVDSLGRVYTVSEDDWSLVRYTPGQNGFVRVGSGYLGHPSGLAIAQSSVGAGGSTGWSLYVSEFDRIWELIDVPGPASSLVDSTVARLGSRVGTLHPKFGRPNRLAVDDGGRVRVATDTGFVLALEDGTGRVLEEGHAGRAGLRARNVAWPRALSPQGHLFAARPGDGRLVRFDALTGEARALSGGHVQVNALAFGPPSRGSGGPSLYLVDGWTVLEIEADRLD